MSKLGNNIALLRKKAEMTQAELGEELNISPQAVSKWEKGLSEPDTDTLKNISKLFNVTVDDLVGGGEDENEEKEEEVKPSDPSQPVVILGYCAVCKKPLYKPDEYEVAKDGDLKGLTVCKNCLAIKRSNELRMEVKKEQEAWEKGMTWGIVAGIAALIALIIIGIAFLHNYLIAFVGGIVVGYLVFSAVSQAFWGDFIEDCLEFFERSLSLPGLIFSLDLEGIVWFITVKCVFGIISWLFSATVFVIGLVITGILGFFTFPFAVKNEREKIKQLQKLLDKSMLKVAK